MKRERIYKKKEITKIRLRKTKNLITNKRTKKEREPDFLKEMYSGLKLLGKKYKNFRGKQKIQKQKEEQRRLKEQEEQELQEQEQQKLQEQEERKLQKEQTLKEEEERRLEAREKQRLEEKKIKEERQEQEKQDRIRKESIKKERQERERQKLIYRERVAKGDRERLKQLEKVSQLRQEEKQLKDENEFLIERKKLNGEVKWFNGAKGYGFIKREGGGKDIFVHFSDVKKSDLKYLKEGEQLTFEIKNSDKGSFAINLQKVTNLQQTSSPFLKLIKKN